MSKLTESEKQELQELNDKYQRLVETYGRGRVLVPSRLERLTQKKLFILTDHDGETTGMVEVTS